MKSFISALCAVLLLSSVPASAQKPISKRQWKKTTRIVYSCENGSVIDPYKEAYTITADKDSVIMQVYLGRKYAGTVGMESSPKTFRRLKSRLSEQRLGTIPEGEVSEVPMGGDIQRISCFAKGNEAPFYDTYITGGVGTMAIIGDPLSAFSELLPVDIILLDFKKKKQEEMQEEENRRRPILQLVK